MITRGWCDAPSAPPSPLLRWCAMGSTNRERLTSALTDGRATRVVMRLGVAIELIIGFTLLVIPDVVIRALIAADGGTTSTIVGRVLGGALRSWDRWRISQGSYARAAHPHDARCGSASLFLSVALGLSAIATGVQLLPLSITLLLAAAGVQKVLTHPHDARCGSASCLSSPAW